MIQEQGSFKSTHKCCEAVCKSRFNCLYINVINIYTFLMKNMMMINIFLTTTIFGCKSQKYLWTFLIYVWIILLFLCVLNVHLFVESNLYINPPNTSYLPVFIYSFSDCSYPIAENASSSIPNAWICNLMEKDIQTKTSTKV